MVIDYKIIKYCRICRKRFVVKKGESKKIYCEECQAELDREHEARKNDGEYVSV